MKISISKTELYAMPHIAWNKFCEFALKNLGNETQYTPVQKNAVLCFWYHSEVCGEGHLGYFDNWESVNKDELTQALRTVGTPEFADNFIEAVKNGLEDDYIKTDKWFGENEATLFKAIEKYLRDNISEFYEITDEDYTMRQPKYIFWIGIFTLVLFLTFMMLFLIVGTEKIFWVTGVFVLFCALGAFIAVYAKMWKVTVNKDTFTVYEPLRQPREFQLSQISKVRETLQGLVVYVDGRKAFEVDRGVNDYAIFYAQIHAAGKMEATQCRNRFVVRRYKGDIIIAFVCFLFFCGLLIWIVFDDDSLNSLGYIVFSVFPLSTLWLTIYYLLWRITISDDTITIKKWLKSEKQYLIRDITNVKMGKENLILYVGKKKIIKVAYNCSGYPILAERLTNEDIPIYVKGRLIEKKQLNRNDCDRNRKYMRDMND